MFDVALSALHDGATNAVPTGAVIFAVGFWEMQILVRHDEVATDSTEAHFAIGFFEREWMSGRGFFAVQTPFVHAPEVRGFDREAEVIHNSRDERELFGRANRAADADRIIGRGLFPCVDVFERFGEIKIFERVVEHDFEAGARELEHFFGRKARGFFDDVVVEGGVIPPIGSDGADLSGHKIEVRS